LENTQKGLLIDFIFNFFAWEESGGRWKKMDHRSLEARALLELAPLRFLANADQIRVCLSLLRMV
jgi:hypothetical protein